MKAIWNAFTGYKTYTVALISVVYAWGIAHNLWPHNIIIDTALGASGLAALRSGVKTEATKIAQALLASPPTLPPLPAATTTTTPPAKVP